MAEMIFLNSGGLDSLATASVLSNQGHTLHSLFLNLGQKNLAPAKAAAVKIASKYCVSHYTLVAFPNDNFTISGQYSVPFNTALMHIIATVYARSKGYNYIASGARGVVDDQKFNEALLNLLRTSHINKLVTPIRPLSDKAGFPDVYSIIQKDSLLGQTYSCRKEIKCGECDKCLLRIEYSIN